MGRSSITGTVLALAMLLLLPHLAWAQGKLTVYSGRKEKAIKPVIEAFAARTGIKVDLKVGKTSGLAMEIIQEKDNPRADIFISTEAGIMEILAQRGVLAQHESALTRAVPEEFRSAQGYWTGISGRARVIIYNTNLVKAAELPRSVFDLTDLRWKNRIAIAGTQERTTLSWVSSLVAIKGEAFTRDYIKKLVANGLKILSDNTDVWQGVGKGEFAVGLTNSPNYYLARAAGYLVGVVYPDQQPGGVGVLVNPNAVALVKGARNLNEARKFIDFSLTEEAQLLLAEQDFEIPLAGEVDPKRVTAATNFGRTQVSQEKLAELAEPTLKLLAGTSPQW